MQQLLMEKQFPQVDPQQVQAMAEILKKQGDHESAARVLNMLGNAGIGVGAGLSVGGAPGFGVPLMAGGGYLSGASIGHDKKAGDKQRELADMQAQAYPGIYGSQ